MNISPEPARATGGERLDRRSAQARQDSWAAEMDRALFAAHPAAAVVPAAAHRDPDAGPAPRAHADWARGARDERVDGNAAAATAATGKPGSGPAPRADADQARGASNEQVDGTASAPAMMAQPHNTAPDTPLAPAVESGARVASQQLAPAGRAAGAGQAGAMAARPALALPQSAAAPAAGAPGLSWQQVPPASGAALAVAPAQRPVPGPQSVTTAQFASAAGPQPLSSLAEQSAGGGAPLAEEWGAADDAGARAAAALPDEYAQRLLHLFQDQGQVQAWIRDAALSPEQAQVVAQALAEQLAAQGGRLSALTVNGRPVPTPGRPQFYRHGRDAGAVPFTAGDIALFQGDE